jgi:SAM-dependent methyltransferase
VSGVDLSEDYCRAARDLSARVGLGGRVDFHCGSVLEMPFEDGHFDVAWTEHTQMNVADKAAFYAELHRVLRPAGLLAFHDVFAGPVGAPYFPVPWAPDASINHLISIEELRDTLASTGFSQVVWEDKTAVSAGFFGKALQRMEKGGAGRPGLGLLMGDPETKFWNMFRNLKEGRICVVQAVMKRAA